MRLFQILFLVLAGFTKSLMADNGMTPLLETYAKLASISYEQALIDAKELDNAIANFASKPSQKGLNLAKKVWLKARESYGLTEAFRLANGPIDAEDGWVSEAYGAKEGQINGWPLDETLIDYTIDAAGVKTKGNIIDSRGMFKPGGHNPKAVNIDSITEVTLTALNENGSDANIATGYHAIEFLLWGQDQDYGNFMEDKVSPGPLTAGQRPLTDFQEKVKGPRRLQYLKAASQKLVSDLTVIKGAWQGDSSTSCGAQYQGCYKNALLGNLKGKDASKNLNPKLSLKQIIKGMGVFIKSELANERIAVAVLTPSEEDEHSCFSDNTHRDITNNFQGFVNILKGEYNGKNMGPSMYANLPKSTKGSIDKLINSIRRRIDNMNHLAKTKWHFDYQILPDNNAKDIKKMKNEMRKLGDRMVDVAAHYKISLTGKDVTDAEETKI